MTDTSKIHLSPTEMEMVQNADLLLTKNRIIEKVYGLLGEVAESVPVQTGPAAKISRGENYQGLPWVMLDYPRIFSKDDTYAIRTFFWWGHFFSITLHLKGTHLQQYRQQISAQLPLLEKNGFHICISNDEWRHEFTVDNYVPLQEIGDTMLKEMLQTATFCRLSVKIPLKQWDQAKKLMLELYEVIFAVTNHQLPSR